MNIKDIYNCVNPLNIYNEISINLNNISIDTRKIKQNDCYIGIKGEKNDGNMLYMEAFNKGAILAILDNFTPNEEVLNYLKENNKSIIVVNSSIEALGSLAKITRDKFKNPVIAITGSAGKTSTKDMVYSVLKEKYNAHKTIGNQNNHIGLPLSILSLNKDNEVLVLEMGMNHLKEISYLTNIAKPDIALITNVGTAHIGNLGSRENILKAKLEILEGLNPNGILIINNDNDLLHGWYLNNKDNYHIITVGINESSDFCASNIIEEENYSTFKCNGFTYKVPVGGIHFVYNALFSIAVASCFDIDEKSISHGILNFEVSCNRMHTINLKDKDITVIDDSYNANFDSMRFAIKYLSSLEGRRIAVLGDMKELGNYSKDIHKNIGHVLNEEEIDYLITVGDESIYINETSNLPENVNKHFNTNKEAIDYLKKIATENDKILIKASNSMNFKEIVESICGDHS